ncbi:hypothetical protein ACYSNX_13005 [Myroides sp. LJL115]
MTRIDSVIKYSSPLAIQYIIVSNTQNYRDSEFYVNSFNLLRTLPIELLQLENSIQYFVFNFRTKTIKSYELFSLPSEFFDFEKYVVASNLKNYSENFGVQSIIKVFIIDSSLKNHKAIANSLEVIDNCYCILIGEINDSVNKYLSLNLFRTANEFIQLIVRDIKKINSELDSFYSGSNTTIEMNLQLQINPNKTFISENTIPGSIFASNNYFVLNQMIGNYWLDVNNKFGTVETLPEERTKEIVDQCQKIDSIYSMLYNHVGIKPTDPFQPIYPTLVLIQPYHCFDPYVSSRAATSCLA